MVTLVPHTDCSTAREAASARLDGELSELEAAHLDGHLRACPECRAYASTIDAFAARLRSEPLEEPKIQVFTPVRRRPAARLQVAAVAASVVAATVGSFAVGRVVGSQGGAPVATVGTTAVDAALRRRVELLGMLRGHGPTRGDIGRVIPV